MNQRRLDLSRIKRINRIYRNSSGIPVIFDISPDVFRQIGSIPEHYPGAARAAGMAAKKKHAKLHNAFASPLLWGAVGFLCYLPYFLAFYPGVTTPDSIWQIRQALHLVPYNSQHPFLHTLFIELCMRIRGGDVNRGNAVYSLLQMGFLCVCYQAVLTMLRKELAPRWFLVLCWMFFFLCPYCAVYSITMWKDVPFGAAVLVLFVYVWHRCRRQAVWTPGARILFFVLSLLVSLLRSNGFIAWCIFILVFALADWRRFRRLLVPSVLVILCTILWNGPIQNACGVEKADFTEALSIPLQQVTYTVIEDEKDEEHELITEDEYAVLSEVMDVAKAADMHDTWLADATKDLVRQSGGGEKIKAHPFRYAAVYLRIGLRNPKCYRKAWYDQTYGYYMPTLGTKAGYSSEVQENDIGLVRTYHLPYAAVIFMYNILNNFTQVYTYAWCAAYNFYLLAASMIALTVRAHRYVRRGHARTGTAALSLGTAYVYMLPLGVLITVLLSTPVANDLRYVWALFLSWLPGIYMAAAPPAGRK